MITLSWCVYTSVCIWVGVRRVGVYCFPHDKTKTRDRNDLKLGTVVVLDTMILASKGQGSGA